MPNFNNMMKIFLIFIFFIICNSFCYGQESYSGKFRQVHNPGVIYFETDEFTFTNDSFIFNHYTDVGDLYGIGKYKITKSKLILNFTQPERSIDTIKGFYNIDSTFESRDSIRFLIDVRNTNNEIIWKCVLRIRDSNDRTLYGASTDSNGLAKFVIPKNIIPTRLDARYVGCGILNLYINDSSSKKISFFLKEEPIRPEIIPGGSVKVFKIRKISDSEFYIKRPEVEYWLHYKKAD